MPPHKALNRQPATALAQPRSTPVGPPPRLPCANAGGPAAQSRTPTHAPRPSDPAPYLPRRRANQVLSPLSQRGLVRTDGQRHVLTGEGLGYLARRDRAAVRMILSRWSARKRRLRNGKARGYAGSAPRAIASQMEHHDALTSFAAALSAEGARSQERRLRRQP